FRPRAHWIRGSSPPCSGREASREARVTDPAVTEPIPPNRRTRIGSYSLCLDDEGRILLARLSALEVDVGAWTMPGGGINFGEHPDAAAVRELEEETGLIGEIEEVAGIFS